ncbi:hypothetical protein [Bacteroides sp.]
MNPLKGQHEIKSLPDFETSMAKGEAYEGLVEGIGYVYWVKEAMYFVHINSDKSYAKPVYQQVPGPYFTFGGKKVIAQMIRRLYIMSEEELRKHDYSKYYQFYVLPKELRKQICETDAIQSKKVSESRVKGESQNEKIKRDVDKVDGILGTIDNVSGLLEDAGKINLPKWVPYAKIGVTGVFMAIDRCLKGDYVDATGRALEALNPYGTWIEIGKAMYNSNLMQQRMAEQYAKEWKKYRILYDEGCMTAPNSVKTEEYRNLRNYNYTRFKECMDQLGYKY